MSPSLQKLAALEGSPRQGTVTLKKRITRHGILDPFAELTELKVAGAPNDDHFFKLTVPDLVSRKHGIIEIDNGEQPARVRIAVDAEEDPETFGTTMQAVLKEAGVEGSAVVASGESTLSPDFLQLAGGKVVGGEQPDGSALVVFEPRELTAA